MFTLEQYVGIWSTSKDWTPECKNNAKLLLSACLALENRLVVQYGVTFPVNPATGSQIGGKTYGGFRPQSCTQGAPKSGHKRALAVDRYDPLGEIDACLLAHPELLEEFGIYIEHPDSTKGWSHWGIKLQKDDPPKSGKHIWRPV